VAFLIRLATSCYIFPGPASQNDLKKMSYYLMIVLDRYGRVLWFYSGSGTAIKGQYERSKQYDNAKDYVKHGRVEAKDLHGHHVRTMVNPDYTVHLRPLFVAGHGEISAIRVVSIEGQFTDVFTSSCAKVCNACTYENAQYFGETG
jgi:hypothetical protein